MHDDGSAAEDLCFYVLMRTDLDSMNPGKGHAQSTHAQKHADFEVWRRGTFGAEWKAAWESWEAQTSQGFGATISLDVDEATMRGAADFALRAGFPAGVTHDPEYPLLDGAIVHLIPLDTCGWIFGRRAALAPLLSQFALCP